MQQKIITKELTVCKNDDFVTLILVLSVCNDVIAYLALKQRLGVTWK